jgi:hypothetical protein
MFRRWGSLETYSPSNPLYKSSGGKIYGEVGNVI